jgi:hypothetical protein
MTTAGRLPEIGAALEALGLRYLVLGGHAVRFYGVGRNTFDYDIHLSLPDFSGLSGILERSSLCAGKRLEEGHSWRPRDFRRFTLGRLPDGREERLEFWRHNHLLPPFEELFTRRVEGEYGGKRLPFLSLQDLLRSKETEREGDWQDIALLEEIQDTRYLGDVRDRVGQVRALAVLRSRVGFDRAENQNLLDAPRLVAEAFARADLAVTRAFLYPFLTPPRPLTPCEGIIGELFKGPLNEVVAGSPRHLALVEVVRRAFKRQAIEADRLDKAAVLAEGT